jgi:hypothetical protein
MSEPRIKTAWRYMDYAEQVKTMPNGHDLTFAEQIKNSDQVRIFTFAEQIKKFAIGKNFTFGICQNSGIRRFLTTLKILTMQVI